MKNETQKWKVLIVEDEAPMLQVLADKFSREGFSVFQAKNGEEGLAITATEKPDVILLDIVMPIMDGMTMLQKVREANEWGKNVPIIILTNLAANDKIIKGVVTAEPSYYLVKSDWNIDDIVRKVRECLEPSTVTN